LSELLEKGIDGQNNRSTEDQDGNNKDNECEEGKDTYYLNDSIKKFISTMFDKQDGNKRTLITRSLYKLLGQNIFHQNLTAFEHNYAEEAEVVFFLVRD
jgi:hypothetical protein